MNYKKEITFHIPLKKYEKRKRILSDKSLIEPDTDEKLTRFFKWTENFQNNEWHQEYFLIYNSYRLDNH